MRQNEKNRNKKIARINGPLDVLCLGLLKPE